MKIDEIREEYTRGSLRRSDLTEEPMGLFSVWLEQAVEARVDEPTAMVVSTSGLDGFPQSRVVLLKSFDREGFLFFTGYNSQKGKAIARDPRVALLFFWPGMQRQIRVTGMATKVTPEMSADYFRTRPLNSRLGAWASPQSEVIPSRSTLEERFREVTRRFGEGEVPCPGHWGGYRVTPLTMEFWQGRANRLHDRFIYTLIDGEWNIARLAP